MSGQLSPAIVLSRYTAHKTMEDLAALENPLAEELWRRIHRSWQVRGMANQVVLAVNKRELRLLRKVGATTRPLVVEYKYLAIYRHPKAREEVRLKSVDKPRKKRSFRIPGVGTRKFVRVKLYRYTTIKESKAKMAATKSKKSKKKAEEEIEELEGLEELDEIEEPEDDEEEEETPKKKRRAKKSKKSSKKKSKPKDEDEDEEDDEDEDEDEDDDDEEEEDEEPVSKKRKRSKKESAKASKKKSSKKDKKSKKGGKGGAGKTTKEVTGGVGTAELAEAATELAEVEIDGRDVRVYLRKNEIPKDEEHGRYTWPSTKNKDFVKLAKAIAKEYDED